MALPAPRTTTAAAYAAPLATATPTVTPTPIVYVVQEGDVLGAIAQRYGVSVEALQRANKIENPQFLRIGQQLIIPPKEGDIISPSGLLLPTPTPQPVEIRGVGLYETPAGSLVCLGEVLNTTDVPLTNVQLRVALMDVTGHKLSEVTAFVASEFILPSDSAPFSALFTAPPAGWAGPAVTVMRSEAVGNLADLYVPVTVVEAKGQPTGTQFLVEGVVQNASPDRSASSVKVIVTIYDGRGQVVGFREAGIAEGTLGPGANAPFSVELNCFGGEPADFSVVAVGRASK